MCPGQCEGVILIMRPGQAVAMLRLPVNRSNTQTGKKGWQQQQQTVAVAVKTGSDGGKEADMHGWSGGQED